MGAALRAYTAPSTWPTCGGLKLPPKTATLLRAPLLSTLDSHLAGAGPAHVIARGHHPARAEDLDVDALLPVVEQGRAAGRAADRPRREEETRADPADERLARLAEDDELGGHDVLLVEHGLVVDEEDDPAVEDLDGAAVPA